jgi:hypothetical protein
MRIGRSALVHLALGDFGERHMVCGQPGVGVVLWPAPEYEKAEKCEPCWTRYRAACAASARYW